MIDTISLTVGIAIGLIPGIAGGVIAMRRAVVRCAEGERELEATESILFSTNVSRASWKKAAEDHRAQLAERQPLYELGVRRAAALEKLNRTRMAARAEARAKSVA
ncbi:MAG: hypothetical protein H0U66_09650 [Gemmatimonadaceae bacterium]|nr:hypothetical protein [Gemmatimonadaceae bacterium]